MKLDLNYRFIQLQQLLENCSIEYRTNERAYQVIFNIEDKKYTVYAKDSYVRQYTDAKTKDGKWNKTIYLKDSEGHLLTLVRFLIQNGYKDKKLVQKSINSDIFTFGKYKNEKIMDIYYIDNQYIKWILDNFEDDSSSKIQIVNAIKKHRIKQIDKLL